MFGVIMHKIHNNLLAYCNSSGLKEHKSLEGTFLPITGHFRVLVLLLAVLRDAS